MTLQAGINFIVYVVNDHRIGRGWLYKNMKEVIRLGYSRASRYGFKKYLFFQKRNLNVEPWAGFDFRDNKREFILLDEEFR